MRFLSHLANSFLFRLCVLCVLCGYSIPIPPSRRHGRQLPARRRARLPARRQRQQRNRDDQQNHANDFHARWIRMTESDRQHIRCGGSRKNAGSTLKRYTERVFARIQQDQRGEDRYACEHHR